jgi:cytidine deaminase
MLNAAGGHVGQYLMSQLPAAKALAQAPISGFAVGAAGLGRSGVTYLGFNVERPGRPLHETLHAEAHVVAMAEARGDVVQALATTAPPCGHCRHLLRDHHEELCWYPGRRLLIDLLPWYPPRRHGAAKAVDLGLEVGPVAAAFVRSLAARERAPARIEVERRLDGWDRQVAYEWAPETTLVTPDAEGAPERFLPSPFGPRDLGISGSPFGDACFATLRAEQPEADPLGQAAFDAARRSWSPVTKSPSGIALRVGSRIITGAFLESVAFNPSVTALGAALVVLGATGERPGGIEAAVLVEAAHAAAGYGDWTERALHQLAPSASFRVSKASFDVPEMPSSG